jgi:hypothetical protein
LNGLIVLVADDDFGSVLFHDCYLLLFSFFVP